MNPEAETLYPQSPAEEPAPSLVDQIVGVFTEPVALFKRLHVTPRWGLALVTVMAVSMVAMVVWAMKVDVDAMLRPIMERSGQLGASQVDAAIEMQKKFLLPFGVLGVALGAPLMTLLIGLVYWGIGRATAEGEKPSYVHALSAVAVPSLIMLAQQFLVGAMCLIRPVGGARPEQLNPASLGFYLHSETPKLQAVYNLVDLFTLASFALAYLAARHIMRAKPLGAWILVILLAALRCLAIVFAR
jgi:hypothetical protein